MRVLIINEVYGIGSTGKICADIAEDYLKRGHEVKVAYGRSSYVPENCKKNAIRIGSAKDVYIHALYTRLTDRHGFASYNATKRFLTWADTYKPDLVWLHNVHGYYINVELLFSWLKSKPLIKKKWTLHDCWAFTGHCTNFSSDGCCKWQVQCNECQLKNDYPKSFVSRSLENYEKKRELFTEVSNLELIVPSNWLQGLVELSFLRDYPISVVHNEINTDVFKPTYSDFRKRYNVEGRRMILGVANVWNEKKGLIDFYRLAKMLDSRYVIVLVGMSKKLSRRFTKEMSRTEVICNDTDYTSAKNDKGAVVSQNVLAVYKEITGVRYIKCPDKQAKVICLERTEDAKELAGLYSTADLFVNMTYEDNYPTVNLEAVACGTKVITYRTGGAPETIGFR